MASAKLTRSTPVQQPATPALVLLTREELSALVKEAVSEALVDLPSNEQGPLLLDRRGMARALGIGVDTLDKLRREGLPEILVGDAPRFDRESVLVWLKDRGK